MATWTITITGKGLQRRTAEKAAEKIVAALGENVRLGGVSDASPPESRADRFAAAINLIGEARSEIESLRDELQEWLDGLPENLQSGSKAEELQTAIDELETQASELESIEGADVTFPGMY